MDDVLYHAISGANFLDAIRLDQLRGYSTHRLHSNGTIPWPTHDKHSGRYTFSEAYLESRWYFGICLTRDLRFAYEWNDIVLVFDRHRIRHRHKLVPYNWMESKVKAEAEEFLITAPAGFSCGEAMLRIKNTVRSRKNLRTLTEGYRGQVARLSSYLKEIRIVASPHLKSSAPRATNEAREADSKDRYASFERMYPFVLAYAQLYQIPLTIV
jgi:hypothetical protein